MTAKAKRPRPTIAQLKIEFETLRADFGDFTSQVEKILKKQNDGQNAALISLSKKTGALDTVVSGHSDSIVELSDMTKALNERVTEYDARIGLLTSKNEANVHADKLEALAKGLDRLEVSIGDVRTEGLTAVREAKTSKHEYKVMANDLSKRVEQLHSYLRMSLIISAILFATVGAILIHMTRLLQI